MLHRIYILWFFFGFCASMFVMIFFVRAAVMVGFLIYYQLGVLEFILMLLFSISFIIPFFFFYLVIKFIYSRFYNMFPISDKYKEHIKKISYLIFYLLSVFIFNNPNIYEINQGLEMLKENESIRNNSIIIECTIILCIYFLDYICEKIYSILKSRQQKLFQVGKGT